MEVGNGDTRCVGSSSASSPDPRTGLIDIAVDECWDLLRSKEVGRLAVTVGTAPDVFPVNYRVVGGEIVVRTDAGTKLAAATLMPSVAFEIDDIDTAGRLGWSVVVKGRGREAERLEEMLELESVGPSPWVDVTRTRWLVISPSEVTGRRVPDVRTPS